MRRKANLIAALAVTASVIVIFANGSHCQEVSPAANENGGMGYSMFGRSVLDVSDLSAKLEAKGFSGMSDNFFSVGGGGHSIINNRFIIGGEGHTLLGEDNNGSTYKTSITAGYGFFDLGYVAYSVKDLRIYPLLGIGGGGINLKIAENITSLSFDEVLDNPKRTSELSTGGFLLNFALGVDYLLAFGENEKGRGGLLFGIRAGYTLAAFKGSWMMDDVEISGVPEMGITGPYIRFLFGGGGIGKIE
ncbi:hypothetical protein JXJ21_08430 [candidate division KSB1 bacterium]|nr:hypothetical protein [candidate division KSB1 bacterium]